MWPKGASGGREQNNPSGRSGSYLGSNLSSEGLERDRTSLVIVVIFNVMKRQSAAALSTGGSNALGAAGGAHRVVCSACPLSLPGRGTRSVMSADIVAVRPEDYATGDGGVCCPLGFKHPSRGYQHPRRNRYLPPRRIRERETSPGFWDVLHLPMGQCPRERENLFSGRIPSGLCGLRSRQCPRRASGSRVKESRVGLRRWPVLMCLL